MGWTAKLVLSVSDAAREHPRYAHEAAVTLHVHATSYEGRTNNVSRGGLCAAMADPIAVGVDMEVDLRLVFDEHTHSEPLRLPARVAWCTAVDEAFQIGIAFKALDAELGKYLTMFLRYLDDGSPATPEKRASTIDDRFG